MSVWKDIRKKSLGTELRKEDMVTFWKYGKCNPYKGVLDSKTEKILNEIYSFNGFAPFLPVDILEEKGYVKVYLDEDCTRNEPVTLEQLEEVQHSLEEEVSFLKTILDELKNSRKPDQVKMDELQKRIRRLKDKIERIKKIIASMRDAGKTSILIPIRVLGFYWRDSSTDGHRIGSRTTQAPEIHLMMKTIKDLCDRKGKDMAMMTGIIFVHELMHAFFDKHDPYVMHPDYKTIEEPVAEYGMLCFMEMFERNHSEYKGITEMAIEHVKNKQDSEGVCHYGFGSYLFDDRTEFCTDWVSLFRSVWPSLVTNHSERQEYERLISPIRYPGDERFCECKLNDVLKPKRFFFTCRTVWRKPNSELYFYIKTAVVRSRPFKVEYLSVKDVSITFVDKYGKRLLDGNASMVSKGGFLLDANLRKEYINFYGPGGRRFAFYEEKPSNGVHPPEWVAFEL